MRLRVKTYFEHRTNRPVIKSRHRKEAKRHPAEPAQYSSDTVPRRRCSTSEKSVSLSLQFSLVVYVTKSRVERGQYRSSANLSGNPVQFLDEVLAKQPDRTVV